MRFVKPLDAALVAELAGEHDALVTVEENVVMGGAGSAVAEALAAAGIEIPLLQLGLPDAFIDHGDPAELLAGVRSRHGGHRRRCPSPLRTPAPRGRPQAGRLTGNQRETNGKTNPLQLAS